MPSRSKSQQRLMQAAEHGATFPMAAKVRSSMSLSQMQDFARGSMKGKPEHVKKGGGKGHGGGHHHPGRNLGGYLHPKKGR